jgi:hypothetical protein
MPASQLPALPVNERCRLAACPRTSPEVLDELWEDKNPRVRAAYARNGAACTLTVEMMTWDVDVRVRLAVARRRRVTEDTLVDLARDQVPEVRRALFRRRDLSAWLLDALSQFEDPELVPEVERWRARHPRRRKRCWG